MAAIDYLNHKPDAQGVSRIEQVRKAIITLEGVLDDTVPASRELSVAKTNLEQVRMWAVKGIAMQYPAEDLKL